jgi:hypothetical protein
MLNLASTWSEMGEKVIHTSALAALHRQKHSSTTHRRLYTCTHDTHFSFIIFKQ